MLAQPIGFAPIPQESKACVLLLHQSRIFKPHLYQPPYGRRTETPTEDTCARSSTIKSVISV